MSASAERPASSRARELWLTNSATGKKEALRPIEPGKVRFYSCGPTVYNFIHIGNLRAAAVSDLIYRSLRKLGYDVTYVRNYTDVDDKIINRAREEKTTPEEITRRYTQEVERDYAMAGLLEPTHKTTVTGHMREIVTMIEEIIANGYGYVVEGEVFFSIDRFKSYGKLSRKNIDDLIAGARVEVSSKKKNPLDFTLWKPAKPGEPSWESPWGKGRPGWHIECSAMARRWLGDQIDIHHGGEDLIFPHHENEIAQTEAATGKAPFVRVWVHNGFLNVNQEKMSKSLGNVMRARDFLAQFPADLARMLLLSTHYRSIIDFTDDTVKTALGATERLYEAKKKALDLLNQKPRLPDMMSESAWGEFVASVEHAKKELDEHMANDLNVPGALSIAFNLVREFNRILGEPRAAGTPAAILGAQALVSFLEEDLGEYLGIGRANADAVLERLGEIRRQRRGDPLSTLSEDEIRQKIEARAQAKKAKDFATADAIRKELEEKGILLKDGPSGTVWSFK